MAMLAESRRRQKWSLNPRGTLWANDDNKFGQKLMEKMGWSKGKGLGKDEQGDKDHVSVRLKDNTAGLGYKGKDDEWIKHYEGFEQVLATLNSENSSRATSPCSDAPNNEVSVNCEASKRTSLEALSKNSHARLHYKKFTRGKDLSQRDLDDIECITGSKRAKQLAEIAKKDHFEEVEVGKQEIASGITTIKGGNIQDYFAKKMAMLNSSVGHRANTSAEVCEKLNDEYEDSQMHEDSKRSKKKRKTEDAADICEGNETFRTECDESKKKKKKSKKEKGVSDICEGNENSIPEQDGPEPVKKKNNKEKDFAAICEVNKIQIPECDETKRNNTKSKKDVADVIKVKEENISECDEREINKEEITEENGVAVNCDNTKKSKKKRKKDKDDADICKSVEEMLSVCDETKKNRKKRIKANDAPDTLEDIETNTSESDDIKKSKKKRKKEKDTTGTGEERNLAFECEGKVKKKKKSKEREKER